MADHSSDPPVVYTQGFYEECAHQVDRWFGLDLCQDITTDNSMQVYLYLIDCMQNY